MKLRFGLQNVSVDPRTAVELGYQGLTINLSNGPKAASPLARHVDACQPCRGRVARMEEDGRRFRQFVFPATVAYLLLRDESRRRHLRFAALTLVRAVGRRIRSRPPPGSPRLSGAPG